MQPHKVNPHKAVNAIRRIHDRLYAETDDGAQFYNADKEWDTDTLEVIADLVETCIPRPPVCKGCGHAPSNCTCCRNNDHRTGDQMNKRRWQHETWENSDCVFEGLRLKIKGKYKLVGFWFVCGLDNCPSSTRFGTRQMTENEVEEEFGEDYLESCLKNAKKIEKGISPKNLRVDKEG